MATLRSPDCRETPERCGYCPARDVGTHHRLELVERAGQPGRQTVRQQAERGVTLGAVPASDTGPARGLARVGAVARERTPALRVVRTARETCIAPRPGSNVLLAGVPRSVSKLHRPWPGGGLPARAFSSWFQRGAESTTATTAAPSGDDVDASFGPSAVLRTVWTRRGQVRGTCPPLAHTRRSRPHTLATSATTIHVKGNFTRPFPDCFVIPGNPSPEQSGQIPGRFHERK